MLDIFFAEYINPGDGTAAIFGDDGVLATDGASLDLNLKLAGATFKDLSKVTGIVLPDTPPYQLAGHLKHTGNQRHVTEFKGRVGDSDLAGTATVGTVVPRTRGVDEFIRDVLRAVASVPGVRASMQKLPPARR